MHRSMDKSVELFLKEQKRFDEAGGPARVVKRMVLSFFATVALAILTTFGVMRLLGSFPRSPDHSIKLLVLCPGLAIVGVAAFLFLKFGKPRAQAIRRTCWYHVSFASLVVPTGLIGLMLGRSS